MGISAVAAESMSIPSLLGLNPLYIILALLHQPLSQVSWA